MLNVHKCWWLLAAVLLLHAPVSLADPVSEACRALVLDYAYYRDRPDADAVAELFTEDATLSVLGQQYVGREAIRARIRAGEDGPLFRHLMSTIRIFPGDDDHATGVSYVTVYSAPAGALPRPVTAFAGVGEYHDKFVRTAAGWRIQQRDFVLVLSPATGD